MKQYGKQEVNDIVDRYEEFLAELQPAGKQLKDSSASVARLQKALQKNQETGNLAEMRKTLDALSESVSQLRCAVDAVSAALEGFDTRSYFAGGDFSRELLDACREKGIDVKGEKGVYEMFPYKVRVLGDGEHPGEVYIDRKKLPSFRPSYVAETIRAGQAKLYAAPFKDTAFMSELAEAYETACLKSGARVGSTQALNKIYRCLAPTARARKDYDLQAYAFDLARLYEAGPESWVTKSGARYTFGTSRDGASGIRVLSRTGVESYISTLRPLNDAAE